MTTPGFIYGPGKWARRMLSTLRAEPCSNRQLAIRIGYCDFFGTGARKYRARMNLSQHVSHLKTMGLIARCDNGGHFHGAVYGLTTAGRAFVVHLEDTGTIDKEDR